MSHVAAAWYNGAWPRNATAGRAAVSSVSSGTSAPGARLGSSRNSWFRREAWAPSGNRSGVVSTVPAARRTRTIGKRIAAPAARRIGLLVGHARAPRARRARRGPGGDSSAARRRQKWTTPARSPRHSRPTPAPQPLHDVVRSRSCSTLGTLDTTGSAASCSALSARGPRREWPDLDRSGHSFLGFISLTVGRAHPSHRQFVQPNGRFRHRRQLA